MPARNFKLSAAITPKIRADEFADDFLVLKDQLWCKWCDIPMNTLRKDNLKSHLQCQMHQGNKITRNSQMTPHIQYAKNLIKEKEEMVSNDETASKSESEEAKKRRLSEKVRRMKRSGRHVNPYLMKHVTSASGRESDEYNSDTSDTEFSSNHEETLESIFAHSDSDDSNDSFEGFDAASIHTPTHIKKLKNRKHRTDSSKKNSWSHASPIPIRSMPLKKQMSYNARQASSSSSKKKNSKKKKGTLKIKIKKPPPKIKFEPVSTTTTASSSSSSSSNDEAESESSSSTREQESSSPSRKSLKMKFVMKKSVVSSMAANHSSHRRRSSSEISSPRKRSRHQSPTSNSYYSESYESKDDPGYEEVDVTSLEEDSFVEQQPPAHPHEFDQNNVITGLPSLEDEEQHFDGEVVQEEIVGVEETDIVSWDAVMQDSMNVYEEEVTSSPAAPQPPEEPEVQQPAPCSSIMSVKGYRFAHFIHLDEEDDDEPVDSGLTAAETLAEKANQVRAMAKSVKSAQFKKKGTTTKPVSISKKVGKRKETRGRKPLSHQKHTGKQAQKTIKRTIETRGRKPKIQPKPATSKFTAKNNQKGKQSGYMLWASKMRSQVTTQFPGLAFLEVSKKLGELWKRIPDKEKQMWKYTSEKMASKLQKKQSTAKNRRQGSKMIATGAKKKIVPPKPAKVPKQMLMPLSSGPPHKDPEEMMQKELGRLPLPSVEPIDAAAYMHMVGESLTNLGVKLKQMKRIKAEDVDNYIPMMLDSFMCTVVPLVTLTNQVPQLQNSTSDEVYSETLANLSHFISGA